MALEFNPNYFPPGGRKFIEKDGSVHRGDSWKHLQKVVEAYRLRAGYPVDDVKREIQDQVCGGNPSMCHEVPDASEGPRVNAASPFNNKILQWLAWALGRKRVNAWKAVSEDEALRRAAICQACPKQRALSQQCAGCLKDVATGRLALRDGNASPHQNLHPCGVLKEDCASSVHVEMAPSNNPELPAACWRRG